MKKLLFVLPFVALMGCEKDKVHQSPLNAQPMFIEIPAVQISSGDGSTNLLLNEEGDDFLTGTFLGIDINQMHISNEVYSELESLNQITEYTFSGNDNIQTLSFSNFTVVSSSSFRVDVNVNGTTETFTLTSDVYSLDDFKSVISSGFSSVGKVQAFPGWWLGPVAVVIIKTVDKAIDNCTQIVSQGITACSAQGKCFKAGFCSVDCYSCVN